MKFSDYLRIVFLLPFLLVWMILTIVISLIYPGFIQTFLWVAIDTLEQYVDQN